MIFRRASAAALVLVALLAGWAVAAPPAGVVRATLSNGLRVVIVKNGLAPVVTTELTYRVGGADCPDDFPGSAHALEHMMFRGHPGLSASQFSAITASLGGDFNAGTSQVSTSYHLTVPSDALDVALRIESIRMRGVLNREADWEKERGALMQEIARDDSDPGYSFYLKLLAAAYPGTPYSRTALGTRESFRKTTGASLRKFHRDWYVPNNAVLVVAGDVDPDRALAEVKRHFGNIPSRPLPTRRRVEIPPQKASRIAMDTDRPTGRAVVAWRFPGYDSPDYAAGVVLADVLDSRRGELYALVPKGEALSAEFELDALPKAAIGYADLGFPKGGDGEALLARVKAIVAGYAKDGVPADLVEAAKRREVARAGFTANSVAGLAAEWAWAVAVEGRESPEDDLAAIRKVTVADVNRVAAACLANDTAITALLTPKESSKPSAARAGGQAESLGEPPRRDVKMPFWAKRAVESPRLPEPKVRPFDETLPNGLRLVVVPEDVSPTVTLVGRIRNNPAVQVPPEKEGVDRVLDGLLSYGTRSLDRLAFRKALDDIAADVSAGTDFSLHVPVEGFDRGVELLAGNMLDPALPDDAFVVVREETAATVAGEIRTPAWRTQKALRTGLFPKDDPAQREATRESVLALAPADVRAWHRQAFRPDLATVVVIGQVTPESARAIVEKHFGGWRAEGAKPAVDPPPVPPNRASSVEIPNPIRVQADATLAATVGITRLDPDYYPLQVGTGILAGGFYASRLYRHLREEAGLVYFVGARLNAGRTRTTFKVNFGCDPGNVAKARALAVRDVESMREGLAGPDELQRAKVMLVRRIALSGGSTDSVAWTLARLSDEGLPLDEQYRAARRYASVTAEEVRDAFRKWIRPADFVQVTEGPEAE
jgi:zinc protease